MKKLILSLVIFTSTYSHAQVAQGDGGGKPQTDGMGDLTRTELKWLEFVEMDLDELFRVSGQKWKKCTSLKKSTAKDLYARYVEITELNALYLMAETKAQAQVPGGACSYPVAKQTKTLMHCLFSKELRERTLETIKTKSNVFYHALGSKNVPTNETQSVIDFLKITMSEK